MKKKCNEDIKIDTKTLIVGIDIGKSTHYGIFLTMDNESAKSFKFSNDLKGFKELETRINKYVKNKDIEKVVIGLESTGSYWLPLAYYVQNNTDYMLLQVNSKHTNRFKEVTDNSPNKTDQKDPKVIAQIVQIGRGLNVNLPEGDKANIRELTRRRKELSEDKKRAKNRLHAILAIHYPEILDLFKDISCKTCMYLLNTYPAPNDILQVSKTELSKELKKRSRGRFTDEKIKQLYGIAYNNIGVQEGIIAYASITKSYLLEIEFIDNQMVLLEKEIKNILINLEEYDILKSINGIGDITIATIVSEIGDFNYFKSYKELLKYAGLNLVENSSGNHISNKRISKVGNSRLRTCLYFLVLRLIKKGGIYHEQYQSCIDRGMLKKKAIIALTRKILRTMHSMMKNKKQFEEKYKTQEIGIAA